MNQLAGLGVVDGGADRDLDRNRFTIAAGAVGALAMTAALGLVLRVEAEMNQRVVLLAGLHDDVAAASAVATRRAASGNKLFAAEGNAAVAAIAGFDENFCFIDKHTYEIPTSYLSSLPKVTYTR